MNPSFVYWYQGKAPQVERSLEVDLKVDAVVVGGGVAGLSCAQALHEAGLKVVLIEKDFCGAGASGKSSGFVTPDSEIELSSLLKTYGAEKALQIWDFVLSGVGLLRKNEKEFGIQCDLQNQDSLFVANSASGFKHVKEEHEARRKLGYQSELYSRKELKKVLGSEKYFGAVRYPQTFGINSYLYCQGLKEVLLKAGLSIYENSPVERVEGDTVYTTHGKVKAKHIVLCTDRFLPELGVLKKEIYHVQTFLGITKPLSTKTLKTIFPDSKLMVWDTQLVYNYFRVTGDQRLLVGGGNLLYTYAKQLRTEMEPFERGLLRYLNKKFPGIDLEMETVWPGMLGVSKDLLPVMGADSKNECVWTVGAATGLPWAAALGHYAAERILKGRNELDLDFSWKREFFIGSRLQTVLGAPVSYAVSHGVAKYF